MKTCSCRNQEFTYLIVHDRRSPSFGKFRYRRSVCPQVRFAADQYDRLFWAMFSDFTWPLKKKKPEIISHTNSKLIGFFSKIEWKKFHTHIKLSVRLFFLNFIKCKYDVINCVTYPRDGMVHAVWFCDWETNHNEIGIGVR